MLVGGLDILGLYCIDFSPSIGKQVDFIFQITVSIQFLYIFELKKKILNRLFKALNKFDYYSQVKFNAERLLFLVDKANKS